MVNLLVPPPALRLQLQLGEWGTTANPGEWLRGGERADQRPLGSSLQPQAPENQTHALIREPQGTEVSGIGVGLPSQVGQSTSWSLSWPSGSNCSLANGEPRQTQVSGNRAGRGQNSNHLVLPSGPQALENRSHAVMGNHRKPRRGGREKMA